MAWIDKDDELFLRNGWATKGVYALFQCGIIVKNSHHSKSLTRHEQGLDVRKTWFQTFSKALIDSELIMMSLP